MTFNLITPDAFKLAAKGGVRPDSGVVQVSFAEPKAAEDDSRVLRFVFSDGSIDRSGDTINPDGWDLTGFLKNPVALWSHDSSSPPIGRAANVGPVKGKLLGDIEFMPPEVSPFADSIYRMVKAGYLRGVSVGFMPEKWTFVDERDRPFGINFIEQSLLEISLCALPCNENALLQARADGIDTKFIREWAEKLLDIGPTQILIPRDLLEETFRQAKTPKTLRQKYLNVPAKTAEEIAAETAAAEAARAASEAADSAIIAPGNCGRTKDETCGMTNPQECSVHYVAPSDQKSGLNQVIVMSPADMAKAIEKAGRRISAANRGKLEAALTHHDEASKCIKAVLDSNDPTEPDPDAEDPIDPTELAAPTAGQDDPEQQRAKRIAEAQALRDSIKQ